MADTTFIVGGPIGARRSLVVARKPLHTLFQQIWLVAEHDLSRRAANFLAIPLVDQEGRNNIDWYAHGQDAHIEPIGMVSESEQVSMAVEVLATVQSYTRLADRYTQESDPALQELGAALKLVAELPDFGDVYVVDGRPVVTHWGFRSDPKELRASREKWMALAALAEPAPPPPPPPLPDPPRSQERIRVTNWRFGDSALLHLEGVVVFWPLTLLALLLFVASLFALLLSHRPAVAQDRNLLERLLEDQRSLSGQLHKLRLDVARRRQACSPPTPTPTPTPPAAPPTITHGPLEIALSWSNNQDLDLYVQAPNCGQELSYKNAQAPNSKCGGRLDVDANRDNVVAAPIEHFYWSGPKSGTYRVFVQRYHNSARPDKSTRFVVTATVNGRVLPRISHEIGSTTTRIAVGTVSYP